MLALAACITAVIGGLLRVGLGLYGLAGSPAMVHAVGAHAALMMCGFFGTVIGIERAVAVKRTEAFAAPAAAAAGAMLILMGADEAGRWSFAVAALAFTGVNAVVVTRQRAAHTVLLLTAACAWFTGALLFAVQPGEPSVLAWWFAFLILTIAAERLEMTRLMRRRSGAQAVLGGVLLGVLAGAALSLWSARAGGVVVGLSLWALAVWLMLFDVARRTVRTEGLTRYMAWCLLAGYAWLAVGGAAWGAMAGGHPAARDAAFHAIGLGFVFSMVMGHAPIILPAVARIKIAYGPWFYLPFAVLHGSLALRLLGGAHEPGWKTAGAALNAAALILFALTMVGAALAWRLRHGPSAPSR